MEGSRGGTRHSSHLVGRVDDGPHSPLMTLLLSQVCNVISVNAGRCEGGKQAVVGG